MAFTTNIPAATDRPSQSQSQIQGNFNSLETAIAINHVALNDGDEGKHKFLQMPKQASAPTTLANEVGLYAKKGTGSSTQLFFARDGVATEINMTEKGNGTNGWSFLPSGLLIMWGTSAPIYGGLKTITFPTGASVPTFSAVYHVAVTPWSDTTTGDIDAAVRLYKIDAATGVPATVKTFQVYMSKRASTGASTIAEQLEVNYIAIGLP